VKSAPPGGRTTWITLFAVSMGALEAAVVVYLRELYYPDGFRFPILPLPATTAWVELLRELATMLMMFSVAMLAGTSRSDRFFVFAFLFGVWDMAYYAGLWVMLGWPGSLATWDLLFLIPLPWASPVLYPVLVALMLTAGFLVHDALRVRGRCLSLVPGEWLVSIAGAAVIVVAFCWNWRIVADEGVPTRFPAAVFFAGLLAGAAPFVRATLRAAR